MEKHKLLYPIIIGISIAVGILLANLYYQQAEQTTGFAIPKKVQGNKFDEIMYLLDNNYVDVIDKNTLTILPFSPLNVFSTVALVTSAPTKLLSFTAIIRSPGNIPNFSEGPPGITLTIITVSF